MIQTDAVGTLGRTADLDGEGFYLVKFRFDGSATAEQQAASCRIRMIQQSAGAGYGTHFPLKPGDRLMFEHNPKKFVALGALQSAGAFDFPAPERPTTAWHRAASTERSRGRRATAPLR